MTPTQQRPSLVEGRIIGNVPVVPGHFLLSLELPPSMETPQPGQFVMIREPGREEPLLPRPLSVYGFRRQDGRAILELLCRIAGRATARFSKLAQGDPVAVLGPLGRGFTLQPQAGRLLLLAGGVGVAPLSYLLETLCRCDDPRPRRVVAYVGARTGELLAGLDRLRQVCELRTATDDGSAGYHGVVTDLLCGDLAGCDPADTMLYACGPTPMIRSLARLVAGTPIRCEVSLEERMACGIGACLGCAVAVRDPQGGKVYRRVCHDGPVFDLKDIIFNVRQEGRD